MLTEVGVGDRWVVGGSIDSAVDSGEGSVGVSHRGGGEGGSVVGQSLSSIGDGGSGCVA